ncbi:MAG: hypothetical protein JXX14_11005 [Deltaproteobacteria bacterium]|nr:hypothetical protein [Deltaproteobacteria bacterium]
MDLTRLSSVCIGTAVAMVINLCTTACSLWPEEKSETTAPVVNADTQVDLRPPQSADSAGSRAESTASPEVKKINLNKYIVSYTGTQSYPKKYPISLMFDSDADTAWNAKFDPAQPLPWIEIVLDKPRKISHINITAGWHRINRKGENLAHMNGSIKMFDVLLDGKQVLAQAAQKQTLLINTHYIGEEAKVIRLAFKEIWPGERWNDIAISDLIVFGDKTE